jgi:hypothetical protein
MTLFGAPPPPLGHFENALHLLETALACGNGSFLSKYDDDVLPSERLS